MADPILETLTFALESDLNVNMETDLLVDSSSGQCSSFSVKKNIPMGKCFLPSSVILGQSSCTPCPIRHCVYISEKSLYGSTTSAGICKQSTENYSGQGHGPSMKDLFLKHLLECHNFVVDQEDQIANFHKYILHWKERFRENELTDFCVAFFMDEPCQPGNSKFKESSSGNVVSSSRSTDCSQEKKKFYMISDILPEDKELRRKLWNDRLEVVLEVNKKERDQTDFSRKCIFCKNVISGNRSALFHHMAESHSFHIGQPDNLVFVEELFDFIDGKLNMFVCIYCEKVFKDKTVLREHMRKKQHKRINPTNPEYDKFYVVNYLEPGKSWKALDEEDPEDDKIEEEWMEVKEEGTSIVCLFCSHQSTNFDVILSHMTLEHHFDFLKVSLNCNFYQKVKIVNFVRRCVYQNTCLYCQHRFLEKTSLLSHLTSHASINAAADVTDDRKLLFPPAKVWDQPEYFFPTYENDQFLILLDRDDRTDDDASHNSITEAYSSMVIPEDPPLVSSSKSVQ